MKKSLFIIYFCLFSSDIALSKGILSCNTSLQVVKEVCKEAKDSKILTPEAQLYDQDIICIKKTPHGHFLGKVVPITVDNPQTFIRNYLRLYNIIALTEVKCSPCQLDDYKIPGYICMVSF